LESGKAELKYDEEFGYLRSVLAALDVPESSQMLVYSKTSLQRDHIAPKTPRALYFNDDVYVGYSHSGEILELAVADPKLGAVFYSVEQSQQDVPRFKRRGDTCLICHNSSHTQGVPGFLVRSVFADQRGYPILSEGSFRIDHTSPLEQRWGGWYVTGTHGDQKHLGNMIFQKRTAREQAQNPTGLNVVDLRDRFDTDEYLTPHSDIVALMVLEHQTQAHNFIARAGLLTRMALRHEAMLNRELGEPEGHRWDSTTSRIKNAGEPLVEYLLFCDEAELTGPIKGTTTFAEEFARRGPRDDRGRSLRDLDLTRRMFKYPCSYTIYTDGFDALPPEAKEYVYGRLWEILSGQDKSDQFAHLTADDRRAILEILAATKDDLPPTWYAAAKE
jgi:hypothetical protein